jgi:glycosyltransferase involved in cell wall biosynthesis
MTPANPATRAHVLTLVDHLSTAGGAERLALDIAMRLDRSRFRSTLCVSRFAADTTRADTELELLGRVHEAQVGFLALGRRHRADAWPWCRLARYIEDQRVEVLHSHMFGSNVWGTVVGRLAHVPVLVAHEHSWSFAGEPLRRLLDREVIARFSDAFVAVSRADRHAMIEVERIPPERIRFIPNGIAPRAPTPGRDLRAELGLGPGPLLGAVGSLRPEKRYEVLVEAVVRLRERHSTLRLLIAGGGDERPRLEALIERLGLHEVVLLLGRRNDVPDILAALDVAVSASEREGSPLAIMEYMEAQLPIVATAVGGVPDLIEDGVHGLLVAPGDPMAMAGAIERLLSDPTYAQSLGTRARERRGQEFDLDVMVGNVEALYDELLAAKTQR